ncbi:MAG TPA: response regulator/pilus assembly protein [Chloroflexi bacterium]|nr:response regulator/pilus assembly protein [Chloroflexota bacterium]
MSTEIIPLVVAILVTIVILITLFLLLQRRKRKGEAASADLHQPAKTPSTPPKFIVDPPEVTAVKKASQPEFAPLPAEEPLDKIANGKEKIRILVVDDNRDTADNVSRLLYFEDGIEVVGQAYGGRDGIKMAVEQKPHIVLMDINMPDIDGITATKEMSQQVPYSQVIIMSVQADSQYMRKAMSAGARDYQTKPFSADELINAIRRVYRLAQPAYQSLEAEKAARVRLAEQRPAQKAETKPQDTPTIALYSPKGGSGVSAIAANLAVALQKEHGNVALVDADLQFGDLMIHLNTKADRGIGDLAGINTLDPDLLAQVMLPHASGLKLLLAPQRPELAELITPNKITQIIEILQTQYQAVLIDTSTYLSNQILAALDAANYILIIITPEIPSMKNAKLFLELLEKLEYSLDRVGVIVNRANIEGGIAVDQITKVLKTPKTYFIPTDNKLNLAINKGVSIFEHEANSPSAKAITLLAKVVWEDATKNWTLEKM